MAGTRAGDQDTESHTVRDLQEVAVRVMSDMVAMVLPGRMRWVTAGTSFVIDETRIGGFGYARASRPKLTAHRQGGYNAKQYTIHHLSMLMEL